MTGFAHRFAPEEIMCTVASGLVAAAVAAIVLFSVGTAARAEETRTLFPAPDRSGDPASSSAPSTSPQLDDGPGMLERFNSTMHYFNLRVWSGVDVAGAWTAALTPPESVKLGLSNFFSNLINEPTTAISWAVAGDYENSGAALHRLWINTTQGWLGVEDVASRQGVVVPAIDIGLALCSRGVSEGPYVVLPIVGPRTVRDGLSDFLLVNTLTYLTLAPAIGFPPSLESVAIVEVVEEAGRVAVMRQIDHGDDRNLSAEAVREAYLASRRERCSRIISMQRVKGTALQER